MIRGLTALFIALALCAASAFADADVRLRVGLGAYRDGFPKLAARELWAFVDEAPGDPRAGEVFLILFELESSRENWEGAEKALRMIERQGGETGSRARFELARIALLKGDKDLAKKSLRDYLDRGGEHREEALIQLADLHRESGDHLSALKILDKFPGEFPKSDFAASAHLGAAELAQRLGDKGAALGHLEAALKQTGRPEVESRAGTLHLTALDLSLNLDREVSAIRHAKALIAGDFDLSPDQLGAARMTLAQAGERSGDPAAAISHYLEVPTGSRYRQPALITAGRLMIEGEEIERALNLLTPLARTSEEAGQLANAAAWPLLNRAFQSGDWDTVVGIGGQRWSLLPDPAHARFMVAEALWELGRGVEAEDGWLYVATTNSPFRGSAAARLGAALERRGDREPALEYYYKALDYGVAEELEKWVRSRVKALAPEEKSSE